MITHGLVHSALEPVPWVAGVPTVQGLYWFATRPPAGGPWRNPDLVYVDATMRLRALVGGFGPEITTGDEARYVTIFFRPPSLAGETP